MDNNPNGIFTSCCVNRRADSLSWSFVSRFFLKFKGWVKGVLRQHFGVMVAIQPVLALATMATWIIMAVFFSVFFTSSADLCSICALLLFFWGYVGLASTAPYRRCTHYHRIFFAVSPQGEHTPINTRHRTPHRSSQKNLI